MCIPKIENAYQNIVAACEKKLQELYPAGVPDVVNSRYIKEIGLLSQSDYIDDFEIFRRLSEEGKKTSQYISFLGCTSSSILVYLLGNGMINPLEPHYYCKDCGYMEMVEAKIYGIDLPTKVCPVCGKVLRRDGFRLPLESIWGTKGSKIVPFDYSISTEFLPFAKRVIEKIYPQNNVVTYGIFGSKTKNSEFDPKNVEVLNGGFVILPSGRTINDYPEIISYLEDGEPCISGTYEIESSYNLKRIRLIPSNTIDQLMLLQRKSGIYATELLEDDLSEVTCYDLINSKTMGYDEEVFYKYFKPRNFYEMVSCSSMTFNAFWDVPYDSQNRYCEIKEKIMDTEDFKKFPCYAREDFFDSFLECGMDRADAFQLSELVRKGRSPRESIFDTLTVPDELRSVARMYMYVSSRAHCIELLLLHARMSYYMKWNSHIYSSVTRKSKIESILYLR